MPGSFDLCRRPNRVVVLTVLSLAAIVIWPLRDTTIRLVRKTTSSIRPKYCDIYDVSVPIKEDYTCVKTKTDPVFPVCIFSAKRDIYVSVFLQQKGIWEDHIIKEFQADLRKDPSLGLIDMGTNLGFYSLISAKMGRKVVSIEPNMEIVKHYHKSLQIGKLWEKVVVVRNGLSNARGNAVVQKHANNQGDGRVLQNPKPGSGLPSVRTIIADDLLEVITFNNGMIKIDIQGYEHKVFQEEVASKLFSRVHITAIYLEWNLMGKMLLAKSTPAKEVKLIHSMLVFLKKRKYKAYKLEREGGNDLSAVPPKHWPVDIVFRLTA